MGNPTQILPTNVQIVNVNPLRVTTPTQQQNKNMPPRFMIPQMVGSRPGQPGITLQALQGLQGGQGHLLLKNENGQYQLLRVGSVTTQATGVVSNSTTNNNNSIPTLPSGSIRLQTVPLSTVSATTVTTASNVVVNNSQITAHAPNRATDNTKEKCRKFLANLLELSSREPKAVEKNVRSLIQELVDAKVEPEEFCDRLEKLLNASPQPCLIGFLKKSLPLLRLALSTKEMTIEGIAPPSLSTNSPTTVVLATPAVVPNQLQNNQIRSTVQLNSMQQMRMVPTLNSSIRPIGHTPHRIITPVRVQTSSVVAGAGTNISTMGPGTVTKVLSAGGSHMTLPVVGTTVRIQAPVMSTGTTSSTSISVASASVQTPVATPVDIVTTVITTTSLSSSTITTAMTTSTVVVPSVPIVSSPSIRLPAVPVRHTFVKTLPIRTTNNNNIAVTLQTNSIGAAAAVVAPSIVRTPLSSTIKPIVTTSIVKTGAVSKASTVQTKLATSSTAQSKSAVKEKEKKAFSSSPASSSGALYVPDDDVNDVAAMAGVNLFEESQRILGSTEFVGTQIRSCKDDTFIPVQNLMKGALQFTTKHNCSQDAVSSEILTLISHAIQERLKNTVEKLAVIAEHRTDFNKTDSHYELTQDIRGQLKCIEEIDKIDRRRRNESEREMLLRAAKSRSKSEDPEQVKLKAKAKEMQRAEMEELRQREANVTALLAIGPRKKLKTDPDTNNIKPGNGSGDAAIPNNTSSARTSMLNRPRLKRVSMKDLLCTMEQERETCRSVTLYKSYFK